LLHDFIIIGAGVTGITLCKLLREKFPNILVLEAESEIGGLCKTKVINGHILDIGGGHFFGTKYDEVYQYIFKYLPKKDFNYFQRVSKINIENTDIDYPIESNIWQLPIEKQIEYIISVVRNEEALGVKEPKNYEQWIRWKLGNKICDNYMIPYNIKLWGVEPAEMDIDWLYKIPRVNVEEVIRYCLEKTQDVNKYPAHIKFYYPKDGGFGSIVNAIAEDELQYIKTDTKAEKLVFDENSKTWLINDKYRAKNVINTTPWNDLYKSLGEPHHLKKHFDKIKYNKIVVSLYEKTYTHNYHWRYIPNITEQHHREFYIHNFAPASKNNGIYIETNIDRFNKDKITFQGRNICHFETKAAYPIPVISHADAIKNILEYYKGKNLFGVGRWGQHQYQNADVSIMEAIKFVRDFT
jgi:protoporphyrinogen oxidase